MALLEVTNLVAGYGKVEVISDVSFTLEPGKSVGIVGPNGVGKSTLLQAIARAAIRKAQPKQFLKCANSFQFFQHTKIIKPEC